MTNVLYRYLPCKPENLDMYYVLKTIKKSIMMHLDVNIS